MKHILVSTELHDRLREIAFHNRTSIKKVTDEILQTHLNQNTTPKKD